MDLAKPRILACLIVSCWLIQPSFAQRALDRLLVFGEGFSFSVKEPPNWKGDTENAARFDANVVLRESGKDIQGTHGLIRVRIDSKEDENTLADLEADMREYRERYAGIQFKNLEIKTPQYRCEAKIFFVPGKFYEYVAYVNPGPKKPFLFSVAMNIPRSEATDKELEAFRSTVQSLTLVTP